MTLQSKTKILKVQGDKTNNGTSFESNTYMENMARMFWFQLQDNADQYLL